MSFISLRMFRFPMGLRALFTCCLSACRQGTFLVLACLAPFAALGFTDNPPGGVIWLQGYDLNPGTPGFTNYGYIRIEAVDDALVIVLPVAPGKLVNAASGLINFLPGAGGGRAIYGDVINHGTINAYTWAGFPKQDAVFDNYGTIYIPTNIYVLFYGTNQVFNQYAGQLKMDDGLWLFDGTFNYYGGALEGTPYLINSTLHLAPAVTNSIRFAMTGEKARFEGNLLKGQEVWLQGSRYGNAQMLVEKGFSNAGTIELSSIEGPFDITLYVPEGTLTNESEGRIEIGEGTGGSREIIGDVRNLGTLEVAYDLRMQNTNGVYINEGQIVIETNATLNVSERLVQAAGQIFLNQGNLRTGVLEVKGGMLTGNGVVTGTVLNASIVRLSPGDALNVVGSYTQSLNGVFEATLVSPSAPVQLQPLQVTDDAELSGEIRATLADNYQPSFGDAFKLIKGRAITGHFTTNRLPPLPSALQWTVDYTGNEVTLRVGRRLLAIAVGQNFSDKTVQVKVTGNSENGVVIDVSSDLVHWTPLKVVRPFTGFADVTESYDPGSTRFYRAHPAD